jgi:hypothetical protein
MSQRGRVVQVYSVNPTAVEIVETRTPTPPPTTISINGELATPRLRGCGYLAFPAPTPKWTHARTFA